LLSLLSRINVVIYYLSATEFNRYRDGFGAFAVPTRGSDRPFNARRSSMKRSLFVVLGFFLLVVSGPLATPVAVSQVPDPSSDDGPSDGLRRPSDQRIAEYARISKGAKVYDGLYKLYQKDENLYMEIPPNNFNKPLLCPIAVARGAGMGGLTLNFDEQWVLLFKRMGDKVHLIRRNVHFKAKSGTPVEKAVEITYSDSVLMALRIVAFNPQHQMAPLINLNDIFMTDFAQLGLGHFDTNRSVWHKIKAFPRNIELQVQATYSGGRRFFFGDETTIDPRGNTVVIHYGLAALPEFGYTPRLADDRVGYFLTAVKDFSNGSKDTSFVRYINRWRLEPAEPIDPKNPDKLSVPKRSIKFYIEKTVPHEYRAAVQEGILEWNKAFEKIGFRNAIEVVQQRDDEDFDPEDMNYNTFRWITTDQAFAMGPSRANPLTGEILDADIIFDADMVRYWKQERQVFRGNGEAYEPVSPIQAMDMGWGLDHPMLNRRLDDSAWNDAPRRFSDNPEANRMRAIQQGICQCGRHMKYELGLAAMAIAQAAIPKSKDKDKDKVVDELISQAVKEVVMHEVGHTLGLRHNFKGSTMLPNAQLHDTKITRQKGLVGSVMDYSPVNLAPKGVKQGDFFTTTIGPYDYWAIEYGYKPLSGGTESEVAELKKIASKGSQPGLDYGTDEDTFLTSDPHTNRFDLGADVVQFALDRMLVTEDLLKGLSHNVVDEGEGYQRTRLAFSLLLSQYGNGAYLVSKHIGGEHAYRDHRGDPKGRDPLVPVSSARQREALKFLQEHIFSEKSFQFSPELLRRLAVERWSHWGADESSTDFPLYDRILGIQKLPMNRLLSASVLQRIQSNALKADANEQPVTVAEIFRTVTDGIWNSWPNEKGERKPLASSIIRRNLQREHLKKLSSLVLGEKSGQLNFYYFSSDLGSIPPDARSLARAHLKEIDKRIDTWLKNKPVEADETTVAHLEECRERINKVLSASLQVNE
jgi:Met-zincin/Domain of unknown function (DUF5117)/Domain of unknown function (DUF5118)